ncbi:hypothetical protein K3495_g8866 [Podosphaera aphanis]|nr:hypothetical protein K3495_g8866 [Podosphaera aphanis]
MGLRELLEPLFEKREQNKAAARYPPGQIISTTGSGTCQILRNPSPSAPASKPSLDDTAKLQHDRLESTSSSLATDLPNVLESCSMTRAQSEGMSETSVSRTLSDLSDSQHFRPSSDNDAPKISGNTERQSLPDIPKGHSLRDSPDPEIASALARTESLDVVESYHALQPNSNGALKASTNTLRSNMLENIEFQDASMPKNIYASLTGRKRKKPDQADTASNLENSDISKKRKENPDQNLCPHESPIDGSKPLSGPVRTPWSKSKSLLIDERIIDTSMTSEWYKNINMKEKYKRSDEVTVSYIKDVISKCVQKAYQGETPNFSELRTQIHNMEMWTPDWVKGVLLKKTGILEEKGLGKILEGPDADIFPWDIRDDAKALWLRWIVGDIDGSLLRGIVQVKKTFENNIPGTSRTLDNRYTWKRSWEVIGHNGLINGQWWPLRICCVRDGAHGELEAGISGKLGEDAIEGAYSVVVADGGYQDQDSLNTIQYCSTESKTNNPTRGTLMLTKSWHSGRPIRVLRGAPKTAAKKKQNKYLPKRGIRYDGLYQIKDMEILNAETAYMRFSLHRLPGQDRVRWEGELARPTPQQLRELMLLQLYA